MASNHLPNVILNFPPNATAILSFDVTFALTKNLTIKNATHNKIAILTKNHSSYPPNLS